MKLLYYTWYENTLNDMAETLALFGMDVVKCHIPVRNYEEDQEFIESLEQIVRQNNCQAVFSFNFFPVISKAAQNLQVPYICWIYDSPNWTIFSPSVRNPYNFIFTFDKAQKNKLTDLGAEHVWHLPLAVNQRRMEALAQQGGMSQNKIYPLSFVGSLYENNFFRQIQFLPDHLRGYLEGIIESQRKIYGCNLIPEIFTDETAARMSQYVNVDWNPAYLSPVKILFEDMLQSEVTCRERISILNALSAKHKLHLFTNSDSMLVPAALAEGTTAYETEMPFVFRNSKINLNITLRSIETGIPLRALDIMGAGGLLLSNYQAELAEYFTDGQDLLLFGCEEECLEKTAWYLSHEEECTRIRQKGMEKTWNEFSYLRQVSRMFEYIGGSLS